MKTRKKIPASLSPSILAASINSFGKLCVFCRKKKIRNAVAMAMMIFLLNSRQNYPYKPEIFIKAP